METNKTSKEISGAGRISGKNIFLTLLSLIVVIVGFIAFDQYQKKSVLISEYQNERNVTEKYISDAFQTIEGNLAEIRMREGLIQGGFENPEVDGLTTPEEKIKHEIDLIDSIMEKNRVLIADLNLKVDNQNGEMKKLKRSMEETNKRLNSYKDEVANLMAQNDGLKSELDLGKSAFINKEAELQRTLSDLNAKSNLINAQLEELRKNDSSMNTVYYVVGTYQQLRDANLVEKDGGVIGIGSSKVLSDRLDKSKFTAIDKRELKEIKIHGKKADVITNHDISSYEIKMKDNVAESIVIQDQTKFWSNSKYLVIIIKDKSGDDNIAQLSN